MAEVKIEDGILVSAPGRLEQRDGGAMVKAQSSFKPRNVLVRVMSPVIRRKFHQTQQAILEGLKRSLET